ncbi:methylmalonyl Co-A mutase-associated GTPase MeaB [Filimonas effusa]|uniref:Methylmalonyl Co-A mutase-associated GTPase MeaB n=1 Tax=Filimonas effusa TaxID=2508721 RepID=A0A4Q1D038_9BACT|nr:methylmalonyl Co-A mutase-associated GTPase MeaB [Filimonas effusa]RXK80946.1 methylmalonyl Co-A mutase-associated GTPase MeaB [Filimonas effusa]
MDFLHALANRDYKTIARLISLAENQVPGIEKTLRGLSQQSVPVIGITGPPGAGKSTITDALIGQIVAEDKTVAVLCVDPSSPFNLGALLGDRIRMSNWYTHPNVFIRSLGSRGSLGGLQAGIVDVMHILKAAAFDYILVETVGVGQSEIEIAGLADLTVMILVPEAGDDIQTLKAGIMEVADLFVVNKADRPAADTFIKNLAAALSFKPGNKQVPILKTIASQKEGTAELFATIKKHWISGISNDKKNWLLAEKAFLLIQQKRMKDITRVRLYEEIKQTGITNLYTLVAKYMTE